MANKLSSRDRELLSTQQQRKIGLRPYENGYFGGQAADFILLPACATFLPDLLSENCFNSVLSYSLKHVKSLFVFISQRYYSFQK